MPPRTAVRTALLRASLNQPVSSKHTTPLLFPVQEYHQHTESWPCPALLVTAPVNQACTPSHPAQVPFASQPERTVHALQGGKAGQAEKQDTQTTERSEEAAAGLAPAAQTGRGKSLHDPSGKQPPVS